MEPHEECLQLNLAQFNELVTNHRERFVTFAFTYTRDEDAAEDAVMESFMALWEKRSELPADTNVMSYVLMSVKNKALNYLKHEHIAAEANEDLLALREWEHKTRISSLESFEPSTLYTKEIMQIVKDTLREMTPTTRRIFLMSRLSGKPHKQIAKEMEMTEKGVEFHIGRALKALRGPLKKYMEVFLLTLLLCPEEFQDFL